MDSRFPDGVPRRHTELILSAELYRESVERYRQRAGDPSLTAGQRAVARIRVERLAESEAELRALYARRLAEDEAGTCKRHPRSTTADRPAEPSGPAANVARP